jgi:hypothetical protein
LANAKSFGYDSHFQGLFAAGMYRVTIASKRLIRIETSIIERLEWHLDKECLVIHRLVNRATFLRSIFHEDASHTGYCRILNVLRFAVSFAFLSRHSSLRRSLTAPASTAPPAELIPGSGFEWRHIVASPWAFWMRTALEVMIIVARDNRCVRYRVGSRWRTVCVRFPVNLLALS